MIEKLGRPRSQNFMLGEPKTTRALRGSGLEAAESHWKRKKTIYRAPGINKAPVSGSEK